MLDNLARASLDGALLVGAIWILTRSVPHLPAGVKATLWWCAAAKFVVTLGWTPLVLPVLPAAAQPMAQIQRVPRDTLAAPAASDETAPLMKDPTRRVTWSTLAGAMWILGLCFSVALATHRWRQMRAAIVRSYPARESLAQLAGELSSALSVRRVPRVRMSEDIDSPLVAGFLRPVVLLPAGRFPHMTPEQQRMAICHELAHLQRGDVWLGCVPAAAEWIFFFHPLVRLAGREYAFWREAACDAAVLRALGTAPQAYGRLLLDLGVSRPRPALAAAGAAWSFSNLKRRIVMLQQPSTPPRRVRFLATAVLATTIAAIAPLRLGARSAAMLPPLPPAPVLVPTPVSLIVPPAPEATTPVQSTKTTRQDDDIRFVFMTDQNTNMSGRSGDVERARSLRQGGEQLLWFVHGGREYVVRDEALLKQVQELWAPVSRIGAEQGEIGAKQGAIGAEQGRIGARQGRIGAEQGAIGARQGALGARQARLAARESRQLSPEERMAIERERREIEQEMHALGQEMAALGERMREAGTPMEKLGAEMAVLGEEMSVLGKEMAEASRKARAAMRDLVVRAIASGAAQPVR
jgi:bla regulator protein BlaR1